MLPAQYRMTRSSEFGTTVSRGVRAPQADLVVHALRTESQQNGHDRDDAAGPRIGLVVSKAVGSAVVRHRVSRRLRHVARTVVAELDPADRVVIRALPGSGRAGSRRLEHQLRQGLRRTGLTR